MNKFASIPEAIEAIKAGEAIVIVDDPGRENQGDLFFPAATADKRKVNFMITECRGLICVPLTHAYARRLELPLMVDSTLNTEATGVGFTVSVDASAVKDFGISAADRTLTIQTLASETAKPEDLARPGHVFPLLARPGGVLERPGHTEAATDLAELAGLPTVGVICEILNVAGNPERLTELTRFAGKHGLKIISILDLVAYLKSHPRKNLDSAITQPIASSVLPTKDGDFKVSVFRSILDGREHAVLALGDISGSEAVLTRVHSQCLTGDTFGSLRCDCNAQLHKSMALIRSKGRGIIIYLAQEGRGIGLGNKIKAYALQDEGMDTVDANHELGLPADGRDYQSAADILNHLKIKEIELLTNNPDKVRQLKELKVKVAKVLPIEIPPNPNNYKYLATKKRRFNHSLSGV